MAIYACEGCESPIQGKNDKFCCQCGLKIDQPIPSEFLIPGKLERWSLTKIAFLFVWGLGAIALVINSISGNLVVVVFGVIGLVFGGIFINQSKPIKESKDVLMDTRKIQCKN